MFLAILALPFRRGERWARWPCWLVLIADLACTLTFGRYDPTIHRQSLIAATTLPILLPAQPPRFLARRQAGAG